MESLTTADRIVMKELSARYDQAVDQRDIEGWVSLFAEDGSFESPMGTATGHDELRGLPC